MTLPNSTIRKKSRKVDAGGRPVKHTSHKKERSCATCRNRKVKCSEQRPACENCRKAAISRGIDPKLARCVFTDLSNASMIRRLDKGEVLWCYPIPASQIAKMPAHFVERTPTDNAADAAGTVSKPTHSRKSSVIAAPKGDGVRRNDVEEALPSALNDLNEFSLRSRRQSLASALSDNRPRSDSVPRDTVSLSALSPAPPLFSAPKSARSAKKTGGHARGLSEPVLPLAPVSRLRPVLNTPLHNSPTSIPSWLDSLDAISLNDSEMLDDDEYQEDDKESVSSYAQLSPLLGPLAIDTSVLRPRSHSLPARAPDATKLSQNVLNNSPINVLDQIPDLPVYGPDPKPAFNSKLSSAALLAMFEALPSGDIERFNFGGLQDHSTPMPTPLTEGSLEFGSIFDSIPEISSNKDTGFTRYRNTDDFGILSPTTSVSDSPHVFSPAMSEAYDYNIDCDLGDTIPDWNSLSSESVFGFGALSLNSRSRSWSRSSFDSSAASLDDYSASEFGFGGQPGCYEDSLYGDCDTGEESLYISDVPLDSNLVFAQPHNPYKCAERPDVDNSQNVRMVKKVEQLNPEDHRRQQVVFW